MQDAADDKVDGKTEDVNLFGKVKVPVKGKKNGKKGDGFIY